MEEYARLGMLVQTPMQLASWASVAVDPNSSLLMVYAVSHCISSSSITLTWTLHINIHLLFPVVTGAIIGGSTVIKEKSIFERDPILCKHFLTVLNFVFYEMDNTDLGWYGLLQ